MKSLTRSSVIMYLGTALAVAIPALVVAQTVTFSAGNVLRASDLQNLSGRLSSAEAALSTLQARVNAVAVTKDRFYEASASSVLTAVGTASANAKCTDLSDVAISCSCVGQNGTAGTALVNVRTFLISNASGSTSGCACTGELVGEVANPAITAVLVCLTVD